jgi:sugar (pentulose or hexulose) kinase
MTRGGKRDGAGRKSTGNPTKSIVRRLSIKEVDRLNNYDQLMAELEEKANHIIGIEDFKTYKLKGELVIKVEDLIEAGLLKRLID